MQDFYPDWPHFFEVLRTRPGMWLGGKSVTRLGAFIWGFAAAEHAHGVEPLAGFDFAAFQLFVEAKIGWSSAGSYGQALQVAKSEERAFDLWFEWYDEFRRTAST